MSLELPKDGPRSIVDVELLQELVVKLLNEVADLRGDLAATRQELQEAKDEINRLKGEQGKPRFSTTKVGKLAKSKADKTKEVDPSSSVKKKPKIDRIVRLEKRPDNLPADAIFKGFRSVIERNIRLVPDTVEYQISRWYSPSTGKAYESSLPDTYRGQIGNELVSLVQILHHCGNMTHGGIKQILEHLKVDLSKGCISDILTKNEWILSERDDLLLASLAASPYQQMDGTLSREAGVRMSTQIICGKYHSLFYTYPSRSRLDIYAALQGKSPHAVQLAYTPLAIERMKKAKVSKKHLRWLAQNFENGAIMNLERLTAFFDSSAIFAKTNKRRLTTIAGALAAGYYYEQQTVPIVQLLVTDDGHEYEKVAGQRQMLCWVHAIRHYRKLVATIDYHREILAEKMDQIWMFYNRVKSYQDLNIDQQAVERLLIDKQFDQVFGVPTDYEILNRIMVKSLEKKERLLSFLDHPILPVHNNMAERGARRVVRKRDISFHTWSSRGTKMRDAFMSLQQTASKIGINFLDYLVNRNAGRSQTSIAQLVTEAYAN